MTSASFDLASADVVRKIVGLLVRSFSRALIMFFLGFMESQEVLSKAETVIKLRRWQFGLFSLTEIMA